MTVLTRARRMTGLTHRPGLRTDPARSPRPVKIGTIGAVLIAVVLSLGFAAPAKAADNYASFSCYRSAGKAYWCNVFREPSHGLLGDAGLFSGNGHDYTLRITNHYAGAYTMKVRVVADNNRVIDYPESSDGLRITFGIKRIYVWLVGWALSPALTVQ